MKKGKKSKKVKIFKVGISIAIVLTLIISGSAVIAKTATRTIIYVDDDADPSWYDATHVKTIKKGVAKASDGDTVYVYSGFYSISRGYTLLKTINLIGEDKNTTIIATGGYGDVIYVLADWVRISGFTIKNSGNLGSGIDLHGNHNVISNNIIISNRLRGIQLRLSSNNTILGNIISSNGYTGIDISHLSNDNIISGNTISLNNDYYINYGIRLHDYPNNNNIISGNTISLNDGYGIYIESSSSDNSIYHNNFINNTVNAYDEGDNTWYNEILQQGNYWNDFDEPSEGAYDPDRDGIADSPYNIPGGNNQDRYPLMVPYPSMDLVITDFSATQIFEEPAGDPVECNSHTTMRITATIKNNGNVDITIPFQVSFYATIVDTGSITNVEIGTVEIPSLDAGETAEATILYELQPEITNVVSVFADSTRIIEELNEDNNRASLLIYSPLLLESFVETQDVYKRLSRQYGIQSAREVSMLAAEAIRAGAYSNPQEYVQRMETIAELEYLVGIELEGQEAPSSFLLDKYQEVVDKLIILIDGLMDDDIISQDITWENAVVVAEMQLQVCEIVIQMLN